MKNIHKVFLVFFTVILLNGCSKEASPTQPVSNNPYSGNWQVVFAGDYIGGGDFIIDSNGKFAVSVLLRSGDETFTNTIQGTVANSGSMIATIYYSGSKIGSASGYFIDNAGNGSWSTASTNGTWSATEE